MENLDESSAHRLPLHYTPLFGSESRRFACPSLSCSRTCSSSRFVVASGVAIAVILVCLVLFPMIYIFDTRVTPPLQPGTYVAATFDTLSNVLLLNGSHSGLGPGLPLFTGALRGRLDALRDMLVLPNQSLLIVQSSNFRPSIIRVSDPCGGANAEVFTQSSLLKEPYGIAVHLQRQIVYVSNQAGNNVVHFNLSTGEALGFFAAVDNPRGIALDQVSGNVYVASRGSRAILEYGSEGGRVLRRWLDERPIGLMLYQGWLVYGSAADNRVRFIDLSSGEIKITLSDVRLVHPSGLVILSNVLLVLSQSAAAVFSWELVTTPVNIIRNITHLELWRGGLLPRGEALATFTCG